MNVETGFPASYRLIKLYRKAVHNSNPDEGLGGSQIMLAMDYFDALEIVNFKSDAESFREFMGLNINDEMTEHDVAMQSIPLYCPKISKKMMVEYHCQNPCFRDPLDREADNFRYFGMIQVHITPEILVRFDIDHYRAAMMKSEGDTCDGESIYLKIHNEFFKDIHIIMSEFVKKRFTDEEKGFFRYRVYQSMSVGDFVVAMKCMDPEIPFEAASILRRRKYELEKPVNSRYGTCSNFVLYKTYTLMSLNTHIIQADTMVPPVLNGSKDFGNRRFVLRCVLSNKYWSDEKDINKAFSPEKYLGGSSFLRLNGRYDFTVNLSEKAFLYIHPKLVQFKIDGQDGRQSPEDNCTLVDGEERKACDYIVSLMEHGHISYVNERFLFSGYTETLEAENCDEAIRLISMEDNFLFANERNVKKLEALEKNIRSACHKALRIDTSRSSIIYSMRLLERFVSMCNSINGISDARIYCSIIIKQIEAVLFGVDYYLSWLIPPENEIGEISDCTIDEYYELIDVLDSELKATLEYLNSFAKFILDSSTQSLQTPHYNLETNVSVEKLLLGYSYFVQKFLDWYRQTAVCKRINGLTSEYRTLMVPQPMDSSLSTKTLFNWRKDESLRTRLLVVLCPSFSDLTDFPASVGILLHEVAHSLRYEKRPDRNDVILRYSTELLFDLVGQSIVRDLRKNIYTIDNFDLYERTIITCLADAYAKCVGYYDIDDVQSISFSMLKDKILEKYREFVHAVGYLSRLRRLLQRFFSDYYIRKEKDYAPVIRSARQLFEVFYGKERNFESGIDKYTEIYWDLVIELENIIVAEYVNESEEVQSIRELYDHLMDIDSTDNEDITAFMNLCINVVRFEQEIGAKFSREIMEHRDSVENRKIARYLNLGTYASIERNERDFGDYVETYIVLCQAATIEFYRQMLGIYQEVSSDLHMIKLLGLTPYGYLNFFTRNVPADDILAETYIRRFCTVLCALKGNSVGNDDIRMWKEVWSDIYRSIFKHVQAFSEKYSGPEYQSILMGEIPIDDDAEGTRYISVADYLKALGNKARSFMVDSDEPITRKNMRLIAKSTIAIKDSLSPVSNREMIPIQERFVTELLHCRYLCSNFISLVYNYRSQVMSVYRFEYLQEDFSRGCQNLDDLHKEFLQSGLWKYCGRIARAYNEEETYVPDPEETNRLMAEFVLDMNYSMLYSYAFEMRDIP